MQRLNTWTVAEVVARVNDAKMCGGGSRISIIMAFVRVRWSDMDQLAKSGFGSFDWAKLTQYQGVY